MWYISHEIHCDVARQSVGRCIDAEASLPVCQSNLVKPKQPPSLSRQLDYGQGMFPYNGPE